ncbi:MAG: hypothetical protein Q8R08_02335 [bacterium]|nr:hypothetical protein [bacterium]
MNSLEEAQKIYKLFKNKEGSAHIAGVGAIKNIIDICVVDKPRTVLEMGSGIGTITHALLKFSDALIDGYESNQWCLGQIEQNIGNENRLHIVKSYRMLPPKTEYDLVIVDGGTGGGGDIDDGKMRTVYLFLKYLDRIGKVLVEGSRAGQRTFIRRALKDKYSFRPIRYRPGGGELGSTLYLLRPTRSRFRWLNWLFWEFIERLNP